MTAASTDTSGRAVAPPGWPPEVRPPGAPDWQRSATGWLFDQCPADYRGYEVLRKQPVVLASFAASAVTAAQSAAQAGLATVRADLRDHVSPETIAAAVAAYEREIARLIAVRRGVALIDEALRGRRYSARL